MPDHQADPPASETTPGVSATPAPDGDAGTEGSFATLPRRRFWRHHAQPPSDLDRWWERPEDTEPEV
jgi:hypothetical protein